VVARSRRVAEAIKEAVGDILQNQLKDPRIGFSSVVKVEVSPDLRLAKVYVSVLGDAEAQRKTLAGLQSGSGFIRSELGKRLRLYRTPEVVFVMDDSIAYGVHISKLLMEIKDEQERK
jgi:ribosome-binding factor A